MAAAVALAGRGAFSFAPARAPEAFNFLVVGDSLVSGQGLEEKNKFYYLVKNWLESEVFKNGREVKVNLKAHSGARIRLEPFETEELKKAGISEEKPFHGEVNLSFPSVWSQISAARKEYENPQRVDLMLLSGGVTNVGLSQILNPRGSNEELKRDIIKHCNGEMFSLLEYAARIFPEALIALVGYYPFLSKETPSDRIFNNVLEVYDVPNYLKPVVNNPLNRRLLKSYRNKMVERSLIWATDSTREFQRAVDRLNAQAGRQRAIFVASPLKEENSIGATKAMLYEVGKNDRAQDARAAERKAACRETLGDLEKKTRLEFRERRCELATIGHPTPEGARAYALAIQNALKPLFEGRDI